MTKIIERGVIFNSEMVRALLDGRKTQTRRLIDWRRTRATEITSREDGSNWPWSEDCENGGDYWHDCPFGAIGDRIWVREAFRVMGCATDVARLMYCASERNSFTEATRTVPVGQCTKQPSQKWTPSIHMPRWASRITLEITSVRVERLQNISQKDAIAEGAPPSHPSIDAVSQQFGYPDFSRSWFGQTWQHIYGEESWQANPWVWVIEFKRVEGGAA